MNQGVKYLIEVAITTLYIIIPLTQKHYIAMNKTTEGHLCIIVTLWLQFSLYQDTNEKIKYIVQTQIDSFPPEFWILWKLIIKSFIFCL